MQGLDRGRQQIDSVHQDSALLRLIKACDQADDAGLTRASGADERDCFAGLGFEGNVFENPGVLRRGVVAEEYVFELDMAADRRQGLRMRPVLHLWLSIEQLKDALCARGGGEDGVVEVAHGLDRPEEHAEIQNERRQLADSDLVLDHQ